MTCNKCGLCCYKGFYNTEEVIKGLINNKEEAVNVIEFLKQKGFNGVITEKELYKFIKPYQLKDMNSPSPCLFLTTENECIIHPTYFNEKNIRGKTCTLNNC